MLCKLRHASKEEFIIDRGLEALCCCISGQEHMEAAVDYNIPSNLTSDHKGCGNICLKHSICSEAICTDTQDQFSIQLQPVASTENVFNGLCPGVFFLCKRVNI